MELRDYLNVIRARRGVILLATVIVAAVAIAVTLIQPARYAAQAKVLISEKDTGTAILGTAITELSSQPERALQTQVQLVEVRPVAESTIRKLGLQEAPDALLGRVDVAAIGETNVIAIKALGSTPQEAADIANTMAEEYVAASKARKRASIKAAADEVEQRLNDAKADILALGRRIEQTGRSDEIAAELSIATGTYSTLAEKLEQLRINEQLESGSGDVVETAVVEVAQVSPNPRRNISLGIVVGLVLGLGLAFLYEYLDNTIKSTEEAEKVYGATVLGIVPIDKMDKGIKRRLTIIEAPGSAASEAYRVIRNSLDFINFEHDLKTLLVTSAAPGEGKSSVAANLAMSLTQTGKKVVLVSCDFRRPTTEQFFAVNSSVGLSEVLLGTHTLKSALQRPGDDQLLVLTAGKMPPNPNELLGSAKMQEVIASLEEWADWVIIDTPPVLAVADPVSVARWVDGVVVVSKAGESTREAADKAVQLLARVGARVIGVVVWGLDETKNQPGYGYGYYTGGYYYYRSYYGSPQAAKKAIGTSKAENTAEDAPEWAPEISAGRRIARFVGRLLVGLLAFLAVLAVAGVIAYFLDQYYDWGITTVILSYLPF